ncbi:hypothetical protein BDZ89DRAFT_1045053 [Hymenopellis radicata]|nr:hypothetical protein BDZ89DRAFT_1045053 [Hymenopellis radicata]
MLASHFKFSPNRQDDILSKAPYAHFVRESSKRVQWKGGSNFNDPIILSTLEAAFCVLESDMGKHRIPDPPRIFAIAAARLDILSPREFYVLRELSDDVAPWEEGSVERYVPRASQGHDYNAVIRQRIVSTSALCGGRKDAIDMTVKKKERGPIVLIVTRNSNPTRISESWPDYGSSHTVFILCE